MEIQKSDKEQEKLNIEKVLEEKGTMVLTLFMQCLRNSVCILFDKRNTA